VAVGVWVGNDLVVGVADTGCVSPIGVRVAVGFCVGSDPVVGGTGVGDGEGLILHPTISISAIQIKHFRPVTISILRSILFRG
jgi:hypothetical protein